MLKILEGLLDGATQLKTGCCPSSSAALLVNRGSVLCLNRGLGVSMIERGNQPACWGGGRRQGHLIGPKISINEPLILFINISCVKSLRAIVSPRRQAVRRARIFTQ